MSKEEASGGAEKTTFEWEIKSLPIDIELKRDLLERLRRLEEENNDLKRQLRDCRLEIQDKKETICELVKALVDREGI